MTTLNELFRLVIIANERGGDPSVAWKFSDPDGERSGKSGWSFGDSQFDTQNNAQAIACLKECGFTQEQIDGVVKQTIDVKPLNALLFAHKDIIAKYDDAQLSHCINSAVNFCEARKLPVTDTAALLMLSDTVNQYGSLGDGSAAYLGKLDHPITAEDILNMKLTWKYATASKRGHDDTVRRYDNLIAIVSKADNGHIAV